MSVVVTNMRVLQPSRKGLAAGDLFVLQMPDDLYSFGRVIRTDARIGTMDKVILLYIYKPRFETKAPPPRAALSPDDLLIPPVLTNRLPWSRGYFEVVERRPLEAGEVLSPHCFRVAGPARIYYDEACNRLPEPVEPVGDYLLESFRTIDDRISHALDFPRAPD